MPFGEYENFEDCVAKNQDKEDPEAYCATIERNIKGDTARRVGFDKAVLTDKIKTDNDDVLTIPAIIASEIVQQYDDGYAYKPADELKKMAETASLIGAVPVKVLGHPTAATNYLLLKHGDVNGVASNFEFTKSLKDQTGRPKRRGVKADISWFKKRTPQNVLDDMVNGKWRDVSIGFTFDSDKTSGIWNGQKYDYIQRNIFLNHVAAPIPKGRCAGPVCGIGFDATLKYGIDETVLNKCPVCRTIIAVGIEEASKNLYTSYGSEVLRVIQGKTLPTPPAKVEIDNDPLTKEWKSKYNAFKKVLGITD
jgi:hypothetical protein